MTTSKNKADAWMPLWIGAYLADTMRLTTIQHGAYLLLLMAYWRDRAPLPDDDDELRSITKTDKAEWKRMRPTIAKFFRVEEGVWWHKRVEEEIAKANANSAAATAKAKAGAQARWGQSSKNAPSNATSMPGALPEQCPTPSPLPIPGIPTHVAKDGNMGGGISARVENAVDNSPPSAPPPIPAQFLEVIAARPELDAQTVYANFAAHYAPEKQTLDRWRKWVTSEHGPSKAGTAQAVPGVVQTVPGRTARDPELVRLDQEASRLKPMPVHMRSSFRQALDAAGIATRPARPPR